MSYRDNIFTVFDLMEKKGFFSSNPANVNSQGPDRQPLYKGPVQYPKMLYHPKGETRVTVPAEIISTPFGPKAVGEQRQIIDKIVESPQEEAVLKKLGWLDHPAKSIHAGGGAAPALTSPERIATLEEQVAALMAELAEAKANPGLVSDAAVDEAENALQGARTVKAVA